MTTINFDKALAQRNTTQFFFDKGLNDTAAMFNADVIKLSNFASEIDIVFNRLNAEVIAKETALDRLQQIRGELDKEKNGFLYEEYVWAIQRLDDKIAKISG